MSTESDPPALSEALSATSVTRAPPELPAGVERPELEACAVVSAVFESEAVDLPDELDDELFVPDALSRGDKPLDEDVRFAVDVVLADVFVVDVVEDVRELEDPLFEDLLLDVLELPLFESEADVFPESEPDPESESESEPEPLSSPEEPSPLLSPSLDGMPGTSVDSIAVDDNSYVMASVSLVASLPLTEKWNVVFSAKGIS